MTRVIRFDKGSKRRLGKLRFNKGSKRRLREIRWKHHEAVSAALLFLILLALTIWFIRFQEEKERFIDPFQTPAVKAVENR